jgi:UDP-glucose 4-epimerase
VACEQLVTGSGLTWSIFRLGAALPIRLIMDAGMFDVPLDNRIEFVHTRDVGFALAEALIASRCGGKYSILVEENAASCTIAKWFLPF